MRSVSRFDPDFYNILYRYHLFIYLFIHYLLINSLNYKNKDLEKNPNVNSFI